MIEISESWRTNHPGAAFAVLAMRGIQLSGETSLLTSRKKVLDEELRARYQAMDRSQIRSIPQMQAYSAYYKQFKKTYHILLQLESIVHKNKHLPGGPLLVQAMFMAEMETFLLTAGHDLDKIEGQISLKAATGQEFYTSLRGEQATCKPGDMIMTDQLGVTCSVIYGQDRRTRISNETQRVIYAIYIPQGIQEALINEHLDQLEVNVSLISPHATKSYRKIYVA